MGDSNGGATGETGDTPPEILNLSRMSADIAFLNETLPVLINEWFTSLKAKCPELPASLFERHEKMITYNALGGKYFRGLLVLWSAKHVCTEKGIDFETIKKDAAALAWAIEILQACYLVADDMMDGSITRRGKPCWYRLPEVQNDAINDVLLLESFVDWLIQHGSSDTNFKALYNLFSDVTVKTQLGQSLDLLAQPQGRKSLDILRGFNSTLQKNIVKYKTSFYTFYLPMAAGLIVGGITDSKTLDAVCAVCMEIGEKFQIQDDYLDCYQDPKILGKVGTDIQDHKCSWLCVQALDRMNDEQRALFEANYGHDDEEKIAVIKKIYNDLDLTSVYNAQEEASLARINKLISENSDVLKPEWFEVIIKMVHNRQK